MPNNNRISIAAVISITQNSAVRCSPRIQHPISTEIASAASDAYKLSTNARPRRCHSTFCGEEDFILEGSAGGQEERRNIRNIRAASRSVRFSASCLLEALGQL